MIITLKGADFSGNNIGTLTTVSVLFSLSAGATTSSPIIAERDKSYTATITLEDNYEVGSAGVTVTMGGTVVSGAVTINGKTITVTIANVTGAINIIVPTVNTSTGGETVTITTYYFKDQDYKGYLRGGQYVASENSGTTDYIDISTKPKIGYFGRMGYVAGDTFHALEFYDANKSYLPELSVLGTGSEAYVNIDLSDSKYNSAKYVRASVAKGSAYTVDQFNTWYFVVGEYVEQAPTLETLNKMFPIAGYIGADGGFVDGSNVFRTDYVSITGKTLIEYKGRMGTIGLNIAFYDADKKFISGLETVGNGSFITTNINLSDTKYANAKFVVASVSKGTLDDTTWFSSSFKIS